MTLTIDSSAEDVRAALEENETTHRERYLAIDTEARRLKKELLAKVIARRRALKALLKVVSLPVATGGHAAVEKAAANEQAKQRGGEPQS